jgi:hypothetical protein
MPALLADTASQGDRRLEPAHFGTFDVENYGDWLLLSTPKRMPRTGSSGGSINTRATICSFPANGAFHGGWPEGR